MGINDINNNLFGIVNVVYRLNDGNHRETLRDQSINSLVADEI